MRPLRGAGGLSPEMERVDEGVEEPAIDGAGVPKTEVGAVEEVKVVLAEE